MEMETLIWMLSTYYHRFSHLKPPRDNGNPQNIVPEGVDHLHTVERMRIMSPGHLELLSLRIMLLERTTRSFPKGRRLENVEYHTYRYTGVALVLYYIRNPMNRKAVWINVFKSTGLLVPQTYWRWLFTNKGAVLRACLNSTTLIFLPIYPRPVLKAGAKNYSYSWLKYMTTMR